jgi:hypothetical protein
MFRSFYSTILSEPYAVFCVLTVVKSEEDIIVTAQRTAYGHLRMVE